MSLSSAIIAIALILLSPWASAGTPLPDQVLLIGLDATQGTIVRAVPLEAYYKGLATAFSSINDSLLPQLEASDMAQHKQKKWNLRAVGVGLGLSGTLGLGPIVSVTLFARLRLVFSNSLKTIYPD